ncbi:MULTISPECIES: AraC family transcriptional regulator [unclassified Pseudoclavibacter]|uniref:AraC family transcriptional regulator n=1 Tax=unclassified Pseudoclavibacter TaxID=2615177 RepID=UPI0012F24183|nr:MULTISPECIES: helix-turn-helix domain-containing protein [unclassified Pseudoclavibacter]MBF4457640.1 helix-turn-helix domain-containing protein [Pseudoclavibacter sp. VKM Ac-2867]VXB03431.1 conserved hypothetical protein [Pseudoclavibacter sp. 8L]
MNVELDIALSGDRAVDWLEAHGARAISLGEDFRLFADLVSSPSISITRIWHTPMEVRLRPTHETGLDRVYLSFMMRGTLSVTEEADFSATGTPPIFIHDTAVPARIRTEEESSRFVFGIRRSKIEAVLGADISDERPRIPDASLRRVALATAAASFDCELEEATLPFFAWRNAIETLVIAALRSTMQAPGPSEALLHRSQQLILDHASEPDFSVVELANRVGISTSHLHRVFRAIDTTPATALRKRRLSLAQDLMTAQATPQDLKAIALQAGFRSLRMLQYARRMYASESVVADR